MRVRPTRFSHVVSDQGNSPVSSFGTPFTGPNAAKKKETKECKKVIDLLLKKA